MGRFWRVADAEKKDDKIVDVMSFADNRTATVERFFFDKVSSRFEYFRELLDSSQNLHLVFVI